MLALLCSVRFGISSAWRLVENWETMPNTAETWTSAAFCEQLRAAGLRPTRQRVTLAQLLFGEGDRHVSAECLHSEVTAAGEQISLATVYNTLHQFTRAGLLRALPVDGGKTYFDTNTSDHNHFFVETEGKLLDIPSESIRVEGLPEPPAGLKISHVDVVVRLVKTE